MHRGRRFAVISIAALLAVILLLSQSYSSTDIPFLSSLRLREDFNHDGRLNVADVVTLIIRAQRAFSPEVHDYDGDGSWSDGDAVALMRNIGSDNVSRQEPDAQSAHWTVVGPGGGGGQFNPTIDPFDTDHVLLRCDMTGAYVTFDNGQSWRMFNLRTAVREFEYDRTARGVAYAVSTGLFRTENGGLTWELVYPDPATVKAEHMEGDHADYWIETFEGQLEGEQATGSSQMRVDPEDGDHLWLSRSTPWGASYYVMVSRNRGRTWERVADDLSGDVLEIFPGRWWDEPGQAIVITESEAVLVDEDSQESTAITLPAGSIMEATGGMSTERGTLIYVLTGDNKVHLSDDLGASWQSVTTSGIDDGTFRSIAACEDYPEVVYLSCPSYQTSNFGIFKTEDAGESWSWVYHADWSGMIIDNMTVTGWMHELYGPSWSGAPITLGVCQSDPDVCYGTDYGTSKRTLDGGETWQQVYTESMGDQAYRSRGLDVTTNYGVHFDPFDSLHIFVSYTDIGAFQSFDGGRTWKTGIRGVMSDWRNTCYWMVYDPAVEGRAWSVWGNKHDLPRDKMFRNGYSGPAGGVARSSDGGEWWQTSSSGLPSSAVCTHIVLDTTSSVDSRTLYVSAFREGVYKSTDGGTTWQRMAHVPGENRNYWRLCLLPDGTLFALVVWDWPESNRKIDGGLFRMDPGETSWQQVELPGGANFPNDLIHDPSDPQTLYLSLWPDTDVGPRVNGNWQVTNVGGGLLKSEDGGSTWTRIFREDAHVYAAAVDPDNPETIIINTFDSSAFRTDDGGVSWYRLHGYNFKWGHRPVFDPHNEGMVYLTTFGGGVFYGPAKGDPAAFEDITNLDLGWRWGEGTGWR